MTEIRKDQRFYIKETNNFLVKVELNAGKFEDCFLNDVSISGACIILEKEIFVQRQKEYSFQLFEKQENGNFKKFGDTIGKMIWYLFKEHNGKEMLFLGIEFKNKITLANSFAENSTDST